MPLLCGNLIDSIYIVCALVGSNLVMDIPSKDLGGFYFLGVQVQLRFLGLHDGWSRPLLFTFHIPPSTF